MQERAWRRIRGEAARLAERDREVAEREGRVREEEEAVARGAHRVIPDPEGHTPPTDVERRSPSRNRQEGREERLCKRGDGDAGWRSREQGKQGGRRSPRAPAQNQRRRTGVRSPHCRGGMRGIWRRGRRGHSRAAGRGTWQSWSAT